MQGTRGEILRGAGEAGQGVLRGADEGGKGVLKGAGEGGKGVIKGAGVGGRGLLNGVGEGGRGLVRGAEEVGSGRGLLKGVEAGGRGVLRGAGEGGAGLGGAGTVVLQLQLTRVSQADSSIELTLAIVGLVVVATHRTVDWGTARAAALHHPPGLAGAGGRLVTVQSGADTLRVAAPAVHHDQGAGLQAPLLQLQHWSVF